MALQWKEDGDGSWVAGIDAQRKARITQKGDSFDARITGGDPGGEHLGTAPSLEAAKLMFDPHVRAVAENPQSAPDAADARNKAAFSGERGPVT